MFSIVNFIMQISLFLISKDHSEPLVGKEHAYIVFPKIDGITYEVTLNGIYFKKFWYKLLEAKFVYITERSFTTNRKCALLIGKYVLNLMY